MRKAKLSIFLVFGALLLVADSPPDVRLLDPDFERVISPSARVQKLAGGISFGEGPVWVRMGGYLLFSDIPGNAIMKWSPQNGLSTFRKPIFSGTGVGKTAQIGSNGLTFDRQGRLVAAEHGYRRIARIEKSGTVTTVADRYEGKRFNSPNDLVVKSNGDIYFTDPDFGLRSMLGGQVGGADPPGLQKARELDFTGVYRVNSAGKVDLLVRNLTAPNGLAFSPDEKKLYVCNSLPQRMWMVYDVNPDGTLANGKIFADMSKDPGAGAPDGMKIDKAGDIFSAGPGGIVIFSPQGKHLGTIQFPEIPANLAWGDADGKTLYVTARTGLYRIRTNVEGIRP